MAASLLALIKAIPALWKIFQEAADIYYAEMAVIDENWAAEKAKKRDALLAALKQPGLDYESRNELRRLLYALSRS